ncbi:TonB-dependent receptor family protein [Tepidicaulis sp. LMO-SS28]|uniref:TonB-dependent receptor family protein n=1 Tax=Tepidicaulis sp. LMO-SS28 TaxID=3447455 RepID=UPI003EE174DB
MKVKKTHLLGRCSPLALAAGLAFGTAPAQAEETQSQADAAAQTPYIMAPLTVTASPDQAATVGGSATFIDEEELEKFSYTDVNRVLRQAPGVYIQEEDGYGLRPNIGIRGAGSERSSKITIMEDGVLAAPAPYAAPAAYYFPYIGRMESVEIVKGPAAIKYGPTTVGGAINLFSTSIPDTGPDKLSGKATLTGGEDGTLRAHASTGGWFTSGGAVDVGILLETLQDQTDGFKELDGGGDTGYQIEEYLGKLAFRTNSLAKVQQSLEFKLHYSNEESDETYLGLTLDDFNATPYRRYAASQKDNMQVWHRTYQATHTIELGEETDLTTTAYYTDTKRTWYKLQSVNGLGLSAALEDPAAYNVITGGNSAADALAVRNNNREYYTAGIQTVLGTGFDFGATSHYLELSARYHQDEEDRFQQEDGYTMTNGVMTLTDPGAPGSQANRVAEAEAWAFFVRDTIEWGALTVVPGLRYETIEMDRTDYADANRTVAASVRSNDVDAWLPGISATYDLTDEWQVLAGVHRGFAPPSPGSTQEAEKSWNYEAGARFDSGNFYSEAIGFYSDFSNIVGTCTAATGGGCTIGDQFSGGEAEIMGLEFTAGYDFAALFGMNGIAVPASAIYTYTDAEFKNSFNSSFGLWGDVVAGDKLPYVPEHQLTLNLGLEADVWRTNVTMNYVDETRSQAGQGAIPADQKVDARTIFDAGIEYDVMENLTVFGIAENVTDEVYNVAFTPAGARPGLPRTFLGGVKISF